MKVHVTKLGAAQRQLRAAIRMFFATEDELAVHTVASAAYALLKDLKAKRGRDEAADYYLTAIFYAVRSYRRGALPAYLADDPDAMQWIKDMAAHLPIEASSKFEDVRASISPETAGAFWRKRNRVSNFLKHADRDAKTNIALEEVDNPHLLMQVLSSYIDLVSGDLGAEGMVLWLYFCVTFGTKEELPEKLQRAAAKLEALNESERLGFCSSLIGELNASAVQPGAPAERPEKRGPSAEL